MNVLAVGPNPAYQKAVEIPHFEPFVVNRSTSVRACAGGKGIHFAKAANRIHPGCATVAHLLGGNTGKAIHEWCREDGPQIVTWTAAPTRTCTTLLCQETNGMTEIIEPTGALSDAEVADFKAQVTGAAARADVVALCGTYPACLGENFYADVAAVNADALVVLDGYRGVNAVLESGRVDILKINEYELRSLSGEDDLLAAGELALNKWSLQWLGITAGPDAAALFGKEGHWRFRIPPIDKVANPIGAGDTVSAVFTLGIAAGDAPEKAFAHGLAAATESCLSMTGADFDPDAARTRAEAVVVEPLAAEVG